MATPIPPKLPPPAPAPASGSPAPSSAPASAPAISSVAPSADEYVEDAGTVAGADAAGGLARSAARLALTLGQTANIPAKDLKNKDNPFLLQVDFTVGKTLGREHILELVKAIVEQDGELYPDQDGSSMGSSPKYFQDRWYQLEGRELKPFTLRKLVGWWRAAHGVRSDEIEGEWSNGSILTSWKRQIWGIKIERVETLEKEPFELKGIPIGVDFDRIASVNPTGKEEIKKQILALVKAIVEQDGELYPEQDPNLMTTGQKYFINRWYQLEGQGKLFTLLSLAGWWRQAHGVKAGERKGEWSGASIIATWKKAIWEMEREAVERSEFELRGVSLSVRVDQKEALKQQILDLVKAIVVQDAQSYPGGDPRLLTAGNKFTDRWYRIAGKDLQVFCLNTLAGWWRQAHGVRANETKGEWSSASIIASWKREIFGILDLASPVGTVVASLDTADSLTRSASRLADKPPRVTSLTITFPFLIGKDTQLSREQIGEILKAIVSQDTELYPDGDVSVMSTSAKYFHARYQIGDWEFSLNTLLPRWRQIHGHKADDNQALGMKGAEILETWKREFFGVEKEEKEQKVMVLEGVNLSSSLPQIIDEEQRGRLKKEIGEILRAIVAQDTELYPGRDVSLMAASPKYFNAHYRIGKWEFVLRTLAGRWRQIHGYKTGDRQVPGMQDSQIIDVWKREFFGVKKELNGFELVGLRPASEVPKKIDAEQRTWLKKEIEIILQAIVKQDKERYPDGDVSPMSTSPKYFDFRYRIGDWEFGLNTLAGRWRLIHGYPVVDLKSPGMKSVEILDTWKRDFFGVEREEKEQKVMVLEGVNPLSPVPQIIDEEQRERLKKEIGEILRVIVAQDAELYPDGDASLMSASKKYFLARYRIGDWEFSLNLLVGRWRQIYGHKANDKKVLEMKAAEILETWKREFFGVEKEEKEQKVIVLEGVRQPSLLPQKIDEEQREWLKSEVGEILKAIVAQDSKLYPGGNASAMSMSPRYFNARYQIGGWEFSLSTLALRWRKIHGYKAGDKKAPGMQGLEIVDAWKRNFFGIEKEVKEVEVFVLAGMGPPIDLPKIIDEAQRERLKAEVGEILKAIVAQDTRRYPHGDVSVMSGSEKYFDARYRIGGWEFAFETLIHCWRRIYGHKANDTKAPGMKDSEILDTWKRDFFGLRIYQSMTPSQLGEFIQAQALGELLAFLGTDPSLLIESLSFLRQDLFAHQDVREFVKAYVGLQGSASSSLGGATGPERLRGYLRFLIQALEGRQNLDFSEENLKRQRALLITFSRKAFEEDAVGLVAALREMRSGFLATGGSLSPEGVRFVERLYAETADYFERVLKTPLADLMIPLYAYQKEGAQFLMTHDHALLADEAGMGKTIQAIAAVETLGLKRVLWVTTASNKESLRQEIKSHTDLGDDAIHVVISGNPAERRKQIEGLKNQKYRITNYETLVALQKEDPALYARLVEDLEVMIVDEAQLTDNPQTLRTQAVTGISTPRKWLLTATPYQTRPESIWALLHYLDPNKFSDKAAFKAMYCENGMGLQLLHAELSHYMLRRQREEVLSYFDPPPPGVDPQEAFQSQLADGRPRLARMERVPLAAGGSFSLHPEQSELIAWIIADFASFIRAFNEDLPEGAEPINEENQGPLSKFKWIHKVIYEPEYFGLQIENPLYEALDRQVAEAMAEGKKIILWAWNRRVLDVLEKRYVSFGTARIDGKVLGQRREQARLAFQENPSTRILVANYISGGVGLTLTAADLAIFVQLPLQYPLLYQAEGRHQRLIGLNNVRHAKAQVGSLWMVPQFGTDFIQGLTDARLRTILGHGTLVEQTVGRLQGGERIYQMVVSGYGSNEDLQAYFQRGLLQGMGLLENIPMDYTGHLRGQARMRADVAQAFLPLWHLVQGNEEAQEVTLELMEAYLHYPEEAFQLGQVFERSQQYFVADLQVVGAIARVKNKYVRSSLMAKIPELLIRYYTSVPPESLARAIQKLGLDVKEPVSFVAQLFMASETAPELMRELAWKVAGMRVSSLKNYLEEHWMVGASGILGSEEAQIVLMEKEYLLEGLSKTPDQILAVYRLGLLSQLRPDLVTEVYLWSGTSGEELLAFMGEKVIQAIGEAAGRTGADVQAMLGREPGWQGRVDHLLALTVRYAESEDSDLIAQWREVLGHILDGDLHEWRMGENSREAGNSIDYLEEDQEFWELFGTNHQSTMSQKVVSPQKSLQLLVGEYTQLIAEWEEEGVSVEGKELMAEVKAYREMNDNETREAVRLRKGEELGQLGRSLQQATTLAEKAEVMQKLKKTREILGWMEMDQQMREVNAGHMTDWKVLEKRLAQKAQVYRLAGQEKFAEHLEALREHVLAFKNEQKVFRDIEIEDTDDPWVITRMGALHPELVNCFNPNGNPTFNQHVIAALGSKNMKLVVVRAKSNGSDKAEVVAVAMVKVKQMGPADAEGFGAASESSIYYLEKGIYRKGYDFREEMLGHLMKKGERRHIPVMTDLKTKPKDSDPWVYGTGAYTQNEYVESVFGIRNADSVKHRGRAAKVSDAVLNALHFESRLDSPTIHVPIGIGTSNKPIEKYIAELQAAHVKVLVDVRGSPFSQWHPQYNQKGFKASLEAAGIKYVWLGDTLGNPKVDGERTMHGFEQHMKSESYERGIQALLKIIRGAGGVVALTCSEGKEADCHRKFILEDVRRRLEVTPNPDPENDPPPTTPGGGPKVVRGGAALVASGGALVQGPTSSGGSRMMQTGASQVMAPAAQVLVEEEGPDRVLNLWRGLLFKTSDDLSARSPSPHRDALIQILNEMIKRNNAHEIQKLIESLQGNSLDVTSDGLIRLLEMRHLPNQSSLLARPVVAKQKQLMGVPTSPFQVTPPGAAPVATPVTVGH